MEQNESRRQRWESEANFFDQWALKAQGRGKSIDPAAVSRYSARRLHQRFQKEYRIRLLGDLSGKSILDVGCGEGQNTVLLATLGARVTGIDVSPGAVEAAWQHAEASGVSASTCFYCSPIESFDSASNQFDIIWCDSILHHLIPDLEFVMQKLVHLCSASTLMVIYEPINLSPTLRSIRRRLPIRTEATPGERPLEAAEIDLIRQYMPDMKMRCFSLVGRLDRFVLTSFNYERSSFPRRVLSNAIATVDCGLLQMPAFRKLAGQAVLHGHPGARR
jgi:2-polyprenyl-3-methyl-5-hydroxy-6-metoxy-1,4-benzoquinol methylase